MEVTEKNETAVNEEVQEDTSNVSENVPSPQEAENMSENANRPLLINVPIENENVALNVLVGFINIAQKRGAFAINESAKIHECIQFFIKNV